MNSSFYLPRIRSLLPLLSWRLLSLLRTPFWGWHSDFWFLFDRLGLHRRNELLALSFLFFCRFVLIALSFCLFLYRIVMCDDLSVGSLFLHSKKGQLCFWHFDVIWIVGFCLRPLSTWIAGIESGLPSQWRTRICCFFTFMKFKDKTIVFWLWSLLGFLYRGPLSFIFVRIRRGIAKSWRWRRKFQKVRIFFKSSSSKLALLHMPWIYLPNDSFQQALVLWRR